MKTYMTNDSLWTDLKALPRTYWVLFSGTLINRFGHFVMPFLAVLVPERIRAFGCQRLGVNLGFALGMAVAGMMATKSFFSVWRF